MISPSESPVLVFFPSLIVAIYVLSCSIKYFESFVPLPIKSNKTPVAFGSRVPACPTLFSLKFFLTTFTTS